MSRPGDRRLGRELRAERRRSGLAQTVLGFAAERSEFMKSVLQMSPLAILLFIYPLVRWILPSKASRLAREAKPSFDILKS